MKILVREWTDKEKTQMADIGVIATKLLAEKLDNDTLKIAQVIQVMYRAFAEEKSIEMMKDINVSGISQIDPKKIDWFAKIVSKMYITDVNIILFENTPEIWLQIYMGLFFGKKTAIITEELNREYLTSIKNNELIVKVIYVDDYSQKNIKKAIEELKKWT